MPDHDLMLDERLAAAGERWRVAQPPAADLRAHGLPVPTSRRPALSLALAAAAVVATVAVPVALTAGQDPVAPLQPASSPTIVVPDDAVVTPLSAKSVHRGTGAETVDLGGPAPAGTTNIRYQLECFEHSEITIDDPTVPPGGPVFGGTLLCADGPLVSDLAKPTGGVSSLLPYDSGRTTIHVQAEPGVPWMVTTEYVKVTHPTDQ